MVGELHRHGYGRLRLAPAISGSECHWQAFVVPASRTSQRHGAIAPLWDLRVAGYMTGHGDRFFGWDDSARDTPAQLAARFVTCFPEIAADGRGEDSAYVKWYQAMVESTEPGGLVYAYSPWDDAMAGHMKVIGESSVTTVPNPPPGELASPNPA